MKLTIKEIVVFAMLGSMMFASKMIMEVFPNIHLLGVFIVALTVVFRTKALFPIYIYIIIDGLRAGFATWWIPYLYIWTILWGLAMLIPKKTPKKIRPVVYMSISALHGLLFGVLYAPMQALFFGLNFGGTIAWIISGFPFDCIHAASNFICGVLICPLITIIQMGMGYKKVR